MTREDFSKILVELPKLLEIYNLDFSKQEDGYYEELTFSICPECFENIKYREGKNDRIFKIGHRNCKTLRPYLYTGNLDNVDRNDDYNVLICGFSMLGDLKSFIEKDNPTFIHILKIHLKKQGLKIKFHKLLIFTKILYCIINHEIFKDDFNYELQYVDLKQVTELMYERYIRGII